MKWSDLNTRERDILIHEKVMHLPVTCEGEIVPLAGGPCFECAICHATFSVSEAMKLDERAPHAFANIPHYSTSMDAAWSVIKHIDEHLMGIISPKHTLYRQAEYFLSEIATSHDLWSDHFGSDEAIFSLSDLAELTPEKICLAALKSVGEDIE